jgi:hypothetical protein
MTKRCTSTLLAIAAIAALMACGPAEAATPIPASADVKCRQVWPGVMECQDVKTGDLLQTCKFNDLARRWDCKRPPKAVTASAPAE